MRSGAEKVGVVLAALSMGAACGDGDGTTSAITIPRTVITSDGGAIVEVSTVTGVAVDSAAGAPEDADACRELAGSIRQFAVSGSRRWVSEDGTSISVDLPDWYRRAATLGDRVSETVPTIDDDTLRVVAVEFAEPLQDYFTDEWDEADPRAFHRDVLEAVRVADERSRRLEQRCIALGVDVTFSHPLTNAGGGGGS